MTKMKKYSKFKFKIVVDDNGFVTKKKKFRPHAFIWLRSTGLRIFLLESILEDFFNI